ncbi:AzlD domain-containing protein [Kurthia massiliensis]|uniref:AzlD domain-containing protein n=1 Tax=Kurthia massiliensis TaxID=1033739 RepID=UPI00028849C5|nr:AzlD domain-containing protein [Kurthia massiliensis]
MTTLSMFFIIAGCAFVTWLPRVIPFILVKAMPMPSIIMRFLAYIPVCILSALVYASLFDATGSITSLNVFNTIAFVPTLFIALWTKSLSKTVIAGVITMAALRYFF